MARYVMLVTNNEGGSAATIYASFEDARKAVRDYLFDPDNQPPATDEERARWDGEIKGMCETPDFVNAVRGSDTWKEWIYVAPIEEPTP